jgi:hypothetical protein
VGSPVERWWRCRLSIVLRTSRPLGVISRDMYKIILSYIYIYIYIHYTPWSESFFYITYTFSSYLTGNTIHLRSVGRTSDH